MIRQIIAIVKKHLDEAYDDYEDEIEATRLTPFVIMEQYPDRHQLRRLASELIGVIRGVDCAKLVTVPKHTELFDYLKRISFDGVDEEHLHYQTRELRRFIAGIRKHQAGVSPIL